MGMRELGGLKVADELAAFVETQVLPGLEIAPDAFWLGAADIFTRFVPVNRNLLQKREALQAKRRSSPATPRAFARGCG